jgi:hypothetical protein
MSVGGPFYNDYDNDTNLDANFHFKKIDSGISCGDTEVELEGETYSDAPFEGTDMIETFDCDTNDCHPEPT